MSQTAGAAASERHLRPVVRPSPVPLALLLTVGCVGSGEVTASVSGQIVGGDERPLGPGLVLVERGPVHAGAYETGALIYENGKFNVQLSSGGTFGIHIFHDEYSYLPAEITIDDHQQVIMTSLMVAWGVWMDLTGLPTWPDQPTDATLIRMPWDDIKEDNPIFEDISIGYGAGDLIEITADVTDPQNDLSRMVLAYDEATGGGYAMNPPSAPDEQGNYPNGRYTLKAFIDERHEPGESKWYFVVSDNLCNNTPIVTLTLPPR